MRSLSSHSKTIPFAGLIACFAVTAQAAPVNVTITVTNLTAANSESFAPFRFGFNSGVFDAFNEGQTATAPIISIAEGGSGSAWFPAFAAADPTATLGTVGAALLPGMTATSTVLIDSTINPYFTFAAMVVPSNDHFIGNDSPTEYRLFDAAGNLLINQITQKASDIWDNGSEAFNPLNAAFLKIGNNDLRDPANGVVHSDFATLARFDGLQTAPGYILTSGLTANQDVYRISFSAAVAPEPSSAALVYGAVLAIAGVTRRVRR